MVSILFSLVCAAQVTPGLQGDFWALAADPTPAGPNPPATAPTNTYQHLTVDFPDQASFPAPYNVDPTEGDTFIARWSGYVRSPVTGTVTFQTITDDGSHLNVNGTVLVNQWILQGSTAHQGTINLVQDGWYQITFHMYENGGGVAARLLWSYPGQTGFVVIPSTHLSSTQPPPPPTPNITAAQAAGFANAADVSWTNSGAGVTYELQSSVNGGAFATIVPTTTALTYQHTGLVYGSTYCYQVRAVTGNLMSGFSGSACVTLASPPPRTNGHTEGFIDDNCACGSTIVAPWTSLAALAFVALALLSRSMR